MFLAQAGIPASQVVVIAGSPGFIVGPYGTAEAHDARITRDPNFIGLAAVDAGICQIDPKSYKDRNPTFLRDGSPVTVENIERELGDALRANMGIRELPPDRFKTAVPSRIAAPLAHNLEAGGLTGGLRHWAGLTEAAVASSSLGSTARNFMDSGPLAPDLTHDMLVVSGAMALAPFQNPLSSFVRPERFRVWASCCVPGQASYDAMGVEASGDDGARRLASYLPTHGATVLTMMLAPSYPLEEVSANAGILDAVRRAYPDLHPVPHAPLYSSAACASSLIAFCDGVGQLRLPPSDLDRVDLAVWGASDAPLVGGGRLQESFGAALVREDRRTERGISPAESVRPFDKFASGTAIAHMGGAMMVTTLEFAMRNFLDVAAIVTGWGQSSELGGKKYMAGVGYCGENALTRAMARSAQEHSIGADTFEYLAAHGTGTLINTKTELSGFYEVRRQMAASQGISGPLPRMLVGAIKALTGHPWAVAGIEQARECIKFVGGDKAVGIPTFREPHMTIRALVDSGSFVLTSGTHRRSREVSGAVAMVQGFGGPNGAIAFLTANEETMGRYEIDPAVRDAYFGRLDVIRHGSRVRTRMACRKPGSALELLLRHRWKGTT